MLKSKKVCVEIFFFIFKRLLPIFVFMCTSVLVIRISQGKWLTRNKTKLTSRRRVRGKPVGAIATWITRVCAVQRLGWKNNSVCAKDKNNSWKESFHISAKNLDSFPISITALLLSRLFWHFSIAGDWANYKKPPPAPDYD